MQTRGFILQPTFRVESGRPVAEPVLSLLGLEFDRVVGDDSQLSLF